MADTVTDNPATRALALLDLAYERGFSLRDIGKKSGVSASWISLFKLGKIPNPGYKTLSNLVASLETLLNVPD